MAAPRRLSFYALCLLAGSLLVILGGIRHPMLVGDGAAQLEIIAGTAAWHAAHWSFLFGFALVVAGLAGVASRLAGTPGEQAARAGICVAVFGYGIAAIGVAFMVGAGSALAGAYTQADLGLTGTRAIFIYDMLHPFAMGTIRAGAFAISLSLYAFGWSVATGGAHPRALGALGVAMGVAGVIAAFALPVTSPYVVIGTALATVWQLVMAVVMLMGERAPAAA